jgi:hypothetical protein
VGMRHAGVRQLCVRHKSYISVSKGNASRKGTSLRHVGASRGCVTSCTRKYNSKSSPANLVAKQRKRRKRGQGQLELILVGLRSFTFNSLFFVNFSSIFHQFFINF